MQRLDKIVGYALLVPFVVGMIIYGSEKPAPGPYTSRFFFDEYLTDAGSYATNNTVHVAAVKSNALIPADTPILVYAAEAGTTNWFPVPPERTYAALPADWSLADATNYNYLVALDWVPPQPIITNDVFLLNASQSLGSADPGDGLSAVLPGVELVVPVDYLESTGTQLKGSAK